MMLRWTWLVPPAMRPPERPAGRARRARRAAPPRRRVGTQRRHLEHHLGDPQLEQRTAGGGDRPALVALALGERLVRRPGGHQRGQALPRPRVPSRRSAPRRLNCSSRRSSEMTAVPMWPRSFVSTLMPTPPAVQGAEEAVDRELDVGEEDLVELRPAGHLLERAHLDAGQVHRAEEERDAVVLGGLGVGAGHEDAPVADPPARAPDLLAVDDEAIAVTVGTRAQRSEVAAGARLGEQLAPHVLRRQRGAQVLEPAARASRSAAAPRRRGPDRPC